MARSTRKMMFLFGLVPRLSSRARFLFWVYYSGLILYLGAEFTRAYAQIYGSRSKRAAAYAQAAQGSGIRAGAVRIIAGVAGVGADRQAPGTNSAI